MTTLGKWQTVSILSRFAALFLGLIQSVIITRILSVSEFGLVGIITAVGALFGVAQHLGLASGTTREISAAKGTKDVFKVFISSVAIRYIVTIPLSIILFVLAPFLAENVYHHIEIAYPLRLYSIVLLAQGVQSIFNSIIAGMQKFKKLFLFQASIAILSLVLYIPLVYYFRVNGYFLALTLFTLLSSLILGFLALWPIRNDLRSPSEGEFKIIFKNILAISLGIYFAKVMYTLWLKFGQVTLGYYETLEVVGIFSFAILYSSKLQTISDALTDVNLPVFSKAFSDNIENFKKLFRENFEVLYILIFLVSISAFYFGKDLILLVVGDKYTQSTQIILPLLLSFGIYSYINILKSSVLVPAKMIIEMGMGYLVLFLGSAISYFILINIGIGSLVSMSFSLLAGVLLSFVFFYFIIKKRLNFFILESKIIVYSLLILLLIPAYYYFPQLHLRILFYLGFLILFVQIGQNFNLLDLNKIFKFKK